MSDATAYVPTYGQLAAVAARFGLGPLLSWRPLGGGVVNPALLLNNRAVLRINVREPLAPKIAKEAWVLEFVSAHLPAGGWRVPRVLGVDTGRSLLPYDYMLLEFLPDRPGIDAWQESAESVRRDLSRQLGAALAELHALPLPGRLYGSWNTQSGSLGTDEGWHAAMRLRDSALLEQASTLRALPAGKLTAVRSWLAAHLQAIPERPARVLVHGDFGLWNAMVRNDTATGRQLLSAMFDFEWAQAGPPALDFAPLLYDPSDAVDPAAFLQGYADGLPFDAALLRETLYYQMQYNLDLLGVVHKFWGGQGGEAHQANIDLLLVGRLPWGYALAGLSWPF